MCKQHAGFPNTRILIIEQLTTLTRKLAPSLKECMNLDLACLAMLALLLLTGELLPVPLFPGMFISSSQRPESVVAGILCHKTGRLHEQGQLF